MLNRSFLTHYRTSCIEDEAASTKVWMLLVNAEDGTKMPSWVGSGLSRKSQMCLFRASCIYNCKYLQIETR
jgi:hypothetical protein